MATNLISSINQVLSSDDVARVASNFGVDTAQIERALRAGVPGLLAALTSLVSRPAGAAALSTATAQQDLGVLSSLAGMLGASGQSSLINSGMRTLTSLLGDSTMSALTTAVGQYAGLGTATAKSVMGLLGPVVLGVLGQHQRANGLDASDLAGLLSSQKENIARALPAGFADYLRGTGILDRIGAQTPRFEPTYAKPSAASTSSNLGWILPVLGVLAIGGLSWYLLRPPHTNVASNAPPKVESKAAAPRQTTGSVVFIVTADKVKDWLSKPVYSSDNAKVGEIVGITRDPENKVTETYIDTGSTLGLGATRYRVGTEQIKEIRPDGIVLTLRETEVKSLPQVGEKHETPPQPQQQP